MTRDQINEAYFFINWATQNINGLFDTRCYDQSKKMLASTTRRDFKDRRTECFSVSTLDMIIVKYKQKKVKIDKNKTKNYT